MASKNVVMIALSWTILTIVPTMVRAQYWSAVEIKARDGLELHASISGPDDCLDKLFIKFKGSKVEVPQQAKKGICHVLLDDLKVFPAETLVNLDHVAAGWVLTLPMFPPGNPDDVIQDEHLPQYTILFNNKCVTMRSLERWDDSQGMRVAKSAGRWSCDSK